MIDWKETPQYVPDVADQVSQLHLLDKQIILRCLRYLVFLRSLIVLHKAVSQEILGN